MFLMFYFGPEWNYILPGGIRQCVESVLKVETVHSSVIAPATTKSWKRRVLAQGKSKVE